MNSTGARGKSGAGRASPARKIRSTQGGRKLVRLAAPRKRRRGWLGRSVVVSAVVVLGLLGWAAIARAVAPAGNTSQDRFDVLIVLGAPADTDGNPGPAQLANVTEAVREYERGVAPRIVFTGGAVRNRFVEAQVMARTAEAQGIPPGEILLDTSARNTIENACSSARLMRARGWQSAEVISSATHLPRAALILSRLPLKWRVHVAPPVEPQTRWTATTGTMVELLKTVHYLVWSRQTEPCRL